MRFGCVLEFALLFLLSSISRAVSIMARHSKLPCGNHLAYHSIKGTRSPGVVFLNGFRSEMNGRKAMVLEQHCRRTNRSFVRFDYLGHGESSGHFMDLTLSDWIRDALNILDIVTKGPQILVGSSMGAWIAVHVALQRPNRVVGIVGVAAAPDFTEDAWKELSIAEKQELEANGVIYRPSKYSADPYPITKKLLDDAKQWLLLDNEKSIPITCPVHLIHGQKDTDISWRQSMALSERLDSLDVTVTLIKNGNHRLSEPNDLERIASAVEAIADGQN